MNGSFFRHLQQDMEKKTWLFAKKMMEIRIFELGYHQ